MTDNPGYYELSKFPLGAIVWIALLVSFAICLSLVVASVKVQPRKPVFLVVGVVGIVLLGFCAWFLFAPVVTVDPYNLGATAQCPEPTRSARMLGAGSFPLTEIYQNCRSSGRKVLAMIGLAIVVTAGASTFTKRKLRLKSAG